MKRNASIIFMSLFISTLNINLHALGIGASFTGGGGVRYVTNNITHFSNSDNNYQIGGGLVIDSNMARLKSFNYRLTAGYYQMYGDAQDLSFINTYHSFGYGLVKKRYVRFWMGPQIGIGYGYGDSEKTTFMGMFMRDSFNYKALNASLGLVLGVNINLGKYFSIIIEGGGRYNFLAGTTKYSGIIYGLGLIVPTPPGKSDFDLINHGPEGFASLGVMVRINDTYRSYYDDPKNKEEADKGQDI